MKKAEVLEGLFDVSIHVECIFSRLYLDDKTICGYNELKDDREQHRSLK